MQSPSDRAAESISKRQTTITTLPRPSLAQILPGLILCCLIAAIGYALQQAEWALAGRAWVETLVFAILVGAAVRTAWTPGPKWKRGIDFSGKLLLEFAVVLLGAGISAATIASAGWPLLVSIFGIVAIAITFSFAIGRLLGLSRRLAVLVACGNSICGNSAIAAVAPVIGANGDEVASSIAFTAVLGVVVVLVLPIIGSALHMSQFAYGTLAGLTVYAVPQVIAATSPFGLSAVHVGTFVKLIRVLMLGPVCLVLSLMSRRLQADGPPVLATPRLSATRSSALLVPWFIIGFAVMIVLRSAYLIPTGALRPIGEIATVLTVISMAALGLGVDVRTVSRAGRAVTVTVILSLIILAFVSFTAIRLLSHQAG